MPQDLVKSEHRERFRQALYNLDEGWDTQGDIYSAPRSGTVESATVHTDLVDCWVDLG
jgi:hypothetical protein